MTDRDFDLKKWSLEFVLRIPNNQTKVPYAYLGQVPQGILVQPTTETIIKEAEKIFNYLNGTN